MSQKRQKISWYIRCSNIHIVGPYGTKNVEFLATLDQLVELHQRMAPFLKILAFFDKNVSWKCNDKQTIWYSGITNFFLLALKIVS